MTVPHAAVQAALEVALVSGILVVLASGAQATDRVALTCSGTFASKETKFETTPANNQSFLIDFDLGTVSGSLGDFVIFKHSETSIVFKRELSNRDIRSIVGGIDRVSGAASVTAWLDGKRIAYMYQLVCKRTNPLF